jgi:hypothetical protein
VAGNFFFQVTFIGLSSKQGIFFLHYAWKDFFFPNFFLGINFFFGFAPPPQIKKIKKFEK